MKDNTTTQRTVLLSAMSVDTSVVDAARILANQVRALERNSEPIRVIESSRPKWPPIGR